MHALIVHNVDGFHGLEQGCYLFESEADAQQYGLDILLQAGEVYWSAVDQCWYLSEFCDKITTPGDAVLSYNAMVLAASELIAVVDVRNAPTFGDGVPSFQLTADNVDTPEKVVDEFNRAFGVKQLLTSKRKKTLRNRLDDRWWYHNWRQALLHAATLPFCVNGSGAWKANIDWFLRPDTVAKIIEGRYDKAHEYNSTDAGRAATKEQRNADAFGVFERNAISEGSSVANLSEDRRVAEAPLRIPRHG